MAAHDDAQRRPPTASCAPRPPSPRPARAGLGAAHRLRRMPDWSPELRPDDAAQARRPAGRPVVPRPQPAQGSWSGRPAPSSPCSSPGAALAWDTTVERRPLDLGARAGRATAAPGSCTGARCPRRLTLAQRGRSRRSLLGGSDGPRRRARGRHGGRPWRGSRPPPRTSAEPQAEIRCRRTAGDMPWNCRPCGLGSADVTQNSSPSRRRPADERRRRASTSSTTTSTSACCASGSSSSAPRSATRTPTRSAPSCCCSRPRTPRPTSSCTSTAPAARSTPAWRSTTP